MTQPFPPGTRILTYSRDSGGNRQGESVDQQNKVIERKAKEWRWTIVRQFSDVAKSGRSDVGRNDLKALLEFAKPGVADVVVFWNSARFGREVNDAQLYRSTLRKRGYALYYISDPIPDAGKFTPALEVIKDISNADVSEKISTEVKRGISTLLFEHHCMPGRPPLGYMRKRIQIGKYRDGTPRMASRWIPDPKLAPRIKKAWAMRAAGFSYSAINQATKLYANRTGYFNMFRREAYRGTLVFGNRRVEGVLEPLCTEAQWRAVTRLRKNRVPPRSVPAKFLLNRLAHCKRCGIFMECQTSGVGDDRIWKYYRCASHNQHYKPCGAKLVRADRLEAFVVERLLSLLSPESLPAVYAGWQREIGNGDRAGEIDELRTKLAALEAKISNLLDQIENGLSVQARLTERESERAELFAALAGLESEPAVELPPVEDLAKVRARLVRAMKRKDTETARAIIRQFITRIDVDDKEVDIIYRSPAV